MVEMLFRGRDQIPQPDDHRRYLDEILAYAARAREASPRTVLSEFVGCDLDPASLHVCGLHHVAVYLGDYERAEQVEGWVEHLGRAEGITDVKWGPSYIAPRHHGTQGFWVSCYAEDAGELEMFTCQRAGPWARLGLQDRVVRMSHLALAVAGPDHVRPVIDYLAHHPGLEILSFAAADELGHTYGHLLHRPSRRVLELAYSDSRPGGS